MLLGPDVYSRIELCPRRIERDDSNSFSKFRWIRTQRPILRNRPPSLQVKLDRPLHPGPIPRVQLFGFRLIESLQNAMEMLGPATLSNPGQTAAQLFISIRAG